MRRPLILWLAGAYVATAGILVQASCDGSNTHIGYCYDPPCPFPTAGKAGASGAAGKAGSSGKSGGAGASGKAGTAGAGGGGAGASGGKPPWSDWEAWVRDESAWTLAPKGDIAQSACSISAAIPDKIPGGGFTWEDCGMGCQWTRTTEIPDAPLDKEAPITWNMSLRSARTSPTGPALPVASVFRTLRSLPRTNVGSFVDVAEGKVVAAFRATLTVNSDGCTPGVNDTSGLYAHHGVPGATPADGWEFQPRRRPGESSLQWGKQPLHLPGGLSFHLTASNLIGAVGPNTLRVTSDPADDGTMAVVYSDTGVFKAPTTEGDTVVFARGVTSPQGVVEFSLLAYQAVPPGGKVAPYVDAIAVNGFEPWGTSMSPTHVAGVSRKIGPPPEVWFGPRPKPGEVLTPTKLSLPVSPSSTPSQVRTWGDWVAVKYRLYLETPPAVGTTFRIVLVHMPTGKVWGIPETPGWYFTDALTLTDEHLWLGMARGQGTSPNDWDFDGVVRRLRRLDLAKMADWAVPGAVP